MLLDLQSLEHVRWNVETGISDSFTTEARSVNE